MKEKGRFPILSLIYIITIVIIIHATMPVPALAGRCGMPETSEHRLVNVFVIRVTFSTVTRERRP